jgi:dTDP-4-dehydrorhamnose 3,5-epimerase
MRIEALPLEGLYRLVPEPIADARGFFARCFNREEFEALGLETDFPEWSLSYNAREGTLRGLHWQAAPCQETKLVQCVRGALFDVAVDLRTGSPTRGRWHAVELSQENRHILYIPKGFAHGFQTLADETELLYHISTPYRPEHARGLRWDDAELSVSWPAAQERIISDRDKTLPCLVDLGENV